MSFSDMMESGRGPGVIGMLLALAVIAIFAMLFIFAFDEKFQGGGQTIESVIAGQARDIDSITSAIQDVRKQLEDVPARQAKAKELATLKNAMQSGTFKIESLRDGIKSASGAIASLERRYEAYKDEYRKQVRGKAKGETMEVLEDGDGNTYHNVTIREVTAIGMQIMHGGGLKRIPYEQLPASMVERFQFDPEQKAAEIAKEKAQRARHDAAVEAAKTAASEDLAERRKKEEVARSLASKQNRAIAMENEIRSLQLAIRAEAYKSISRAPQMRDQLAAKQRELAQLQADVARMQAEFSQ